VECRLAGKQKWGLEGACFESGTLVCKREAALAEATARLSSTEARDALAVFDASGSQWRVGMGGATGLDYNAAWLVAGALGIEIDSTVLRFIQVLEQEFLVTMDEEGKKKQQAQPAPAPPSRLRRG
jgi:hypothetical protein